MALFLLPTTSEAQERLEVGLPFTPQTSGYFFTDSQVEDMGREVLRVRAMETKIVILQDLLEAYREKDSWATGYRLELIETLGRAEDLESSGFWRDLRIGSTWLTIGLGVGLVIGVAQ